MTLMRHGDVLNLLVYDLVQEFGISDIFRSEQIRMAQSAKAELTSEMVAKSKAFKDQYIHMFGGMHKYTKRGQHNNKLSRKNVVSRQGRRYSLMPT